MDNINLGELLAGEVEILGITNNFKESR